MAIVKWIYDADDPFNAVNSTSFRLILNIIVGISP